MQALLALTLSLEVAGAADIKDARLWRAPDHTRVVFDLSGPVEHQVIRLRNPDRLVVDIERAALRNVNLGQLDLNGSPIARIRHAVRDKRDLRVVFDLTADIKPRTFVLKANEQYGDRLVIDLVDRNKRPAVTKTVQANKRRDVIIAIDAGHGGEDPGAIGPGRLQEKKVVLAIAKELAALFEREPGYKPVLVREGDYYVGLKQRRDLARQSQADLFVSIHADAFTSPKAHGGSVYALSNRGASSAMAGFLAASENSTDAIGGVPIDGKDDELVKILTDLSMTASLDASLRVGGQILNRMGNVAHLHSRRVEQAAFAVLKSPDIPSILVETGFISNPGEARKLATVSYQRQLARAIFDGVQHYFNDTPPPDTLLAWRKRQRGREHRIAQGDTLSGIAERYQVSVAALREHNGLADNSIQAGQTLMIP